MNNQQMMRLASLQHRVAHLEKEAALKRLKEKVLSMLSSFGKGAEKALLYMPERDIKKAVRELQRNPEFMKSLEKHLHGALFRRLRSSLPTCSVKR